MSVDWTPELTLNDELLDRQHVELFRRLADAGAALGGERARLEAAIAAFADALLDHISTEERLMDETLYPERIRHRSAHELFVADLERLRDELRRLGPTPEVDAAIRHRIPEWLRFHIRVNDAPFGEHLARRRPQVPAELRARARSSRRLS
jgi:hemerythrin-like metal-binding protein